jgi:hypothetical protein
MDGWGICSGYNSRVITQEHLKAVIYYGGMAWKGVGPLTGVMVGAVLARSWDRNKWMNDNRKEEFRDLLDALTDAATRLMAEQEQANRAPFGYWNDDEARASHVEALKIIKTRIYIADDLKEMELFDRWSKAIEKMHETKEICHFENVYEGVRNEIVERATRKYGYRFP